MSCFIVGFVVFFMKNNLCFIFCFISENMFAGNDMSFAKTHIVYPMLSHAVCICGSLRLFAE